MVTSHFHSIVVYGLCTYMHVGSFVCIPIFIFIIMTCVTSADCSGFNGDIAWRVLASADVDGPDHGARQG